MDAEVTGPPPRRRGDQPHRPRLARPGVPLQDVKSLEGTATLRTPVRPDGVVGRPVSLHVLPAFVALGTRRAVVVFRGLGHYVQLSLIY